MRVLIQRVKQASVLVDSTVVGQIKQGILVFLGVAKKDTIPQADRLIKKVLELRIFDDAQGKMNLSPADIGASILVVSQFTLYGNCDKGRRPSFDEAAGLEQAQELYDYVVEGFKKSGLTVETGRFRAMMDVSLINDGPVTFILESNADH